MAIGIDEFIEGFRGAFGACLDSLRDGEGGLAGLGGEVGFCDLWGFSYVICGKGLEALNKIARKEDDRNRVSEVRDGYEI